MGLVNTAFMKSMAAGFKEPACRHQRRNRTQGAYDAFCNQVQEGCWARPVPPSREKARHLQEGFCRPCPVAYSPGRHPSETAVAEPAERTPRSRTRSMSKGRKPTPEELARALRENLRRRKVQQRARQADKEASSTARREDRQPPASAGSHGLPAERKPPDSR